MKKYLYPASILLPDFQKIDGSKWSCVACDQFTSEPEYWARVSEYVKDAPSTLRLMLPELYLAEGNVRIPQINSNMKQYLEDTLTAYDDSMIYLERTQSDGRIRRGLVGCIDLEEYDYKKGSKTLIRATEGTVLERIPPRVAVRRGAMLEMPHILILIDDQDRRVVEPVADSKETLTWAYDFDLMEGGGHVSGYFVDHTGQDKINAALASLVNESENSSPLLFAIGDGNHSLASAKAMYEEIKAELGEDAAREHPARYALCEIVNIYDEAIEFEPIYRVAFDVDVDDLLTRLSEYAVAQNGHGAPQRVEFVSRKGEGSIEISHPSSMLPVGSVQQFLDEYCMSRPNVKVDYIHGLETARSLADRENTVALIFEGMKKNELFGTVIADGALPKKTFSMGHARDKRYYLECRKIR